MIQDRIDEIDFQIASLRERRKTLVKELNEKKIDPELKKFLAIFSKTKPLSRQDIRDAFPNLSDPEIRSRLDKGKKKGFVVNTGTRHQPRWIRRGV